MITVEMTYGQEEYEILADMAVDQQKQKKGRKVWKVIFIIIGIFELGYGILTLFTGANALTGIGLVTAAVAFFIAFGGEQFLLRAVVLRKTKKMNRNAAGLKRKLTFDEKKCTITSEEGTGEYGWDAFTAWGEHGHYLWIRRNDNRYVLVDMKKLTEKYGNLLRRYCKEKIAGK